MKKLPVSLESILLFITLTGMVFVPEKRVPLFVWPLIAGVGNLGYVSYRVVQNHTLRDKEFGPAMITVGFLALSIGMIYDRQRSGVAFLFPLTALLVTGVVWAAWKATKPSKE